DQEARRPAEGFKMQEPRSGNLPDSSPTKVDENGSVSRLQAECEELRQRVAELEKERERDRKALQDVEAERNLYQAEALAWAKKEFERQGMMSDEELKRRIDQEDGLPLEAFIDDLIVGAPHSATLTP